MSSKRKIIHFMGMFIRAVFLSFFPCWIISQAQEDYQVKIEKGIAVPMRDNVKLYADIFRPDAKGKFPVILIRTPYNKERYSEYSFFPFYAAQRGYVIIIQDIRGRYKSEGEFSPYKPDFNDGYDSVEWAASLPYSNGKIGTQGCSYLVAEYSGKLQLQALLI